VGTLALLCGVLFAQSGDPIRIGVGRDAKWSPDESKISLIRNDSLYFIELAPDHKEHFLHFGPILRYFWVDDSTLVALERSNTATSQGRSFTKRVTRVSITGNTETIAEENYTSSTPDTRALNLTKFPNGKVGYYDKLVSMHRPLSVISGRELTDTGSTPLNLYVGTEPYPWGKVWLYYGSPTDKRLITQSENHYLLPKLAPTEDKFFCSSPRGDLVVFDTLGDELYNLGRGTMESWDQSGKNIVFAITEETEFNIVSAELHVAHLGDSLTIKPLAAPGVVTCEPMFSPSGRKVLFTDCHSWEIYVSKLGN
jgi:hypothetical protein